MSKTLKNAILKKTLQAFEKAYPDAYIVSEKASGSRERFNFIIVSEKFKKKRPLKRQEMVWDVVQRAVTGDEIYSIGFIFPLPENEIEVEEFLKEVKEAKQKKQRKSAEKKTIPASIRS